MITPPAAHPPRHRCLARPQVVVTDGRPRHPSGALVGRPRRSDTPATRAGLPEPAEFYAKTLRGTFAIPRNGKSQSGKESARIGKKPMRPKRVVGGGESGDDGSDADDQPPELMSDESEPEEDDPSAPKRRMPQQPQQPARKQKASTAAAADDDDNADDDDKLVVSLTIQKDGGDLSDQQIKDVLVAFGTHPSFKDRQAARPSRCNAGACDPHTPPSPKTGNLITSGLTPQSFRLQR